MMLYPVDCVYSGVATFWILLNSTHLRCKYLQHVVPTPDCGQCRHCVNILVDDWFLEQPLGLSALCRNTIKTRKFHNMLHTIPNFNLIPSSNGDLQYQLGKIFLIHSKIPCCCFFHVKLGKLGGHTFCKLEKVH